MQTHVTRISDRRLAQFQAVSGLLFATFLVLHLVNTMLAAFGQGTYDGYQRFVRSYYQATGLEILLILVAPSVHIAVGVVRFVRRRKKEKSKPSRRAPPWRLRLHRYAGVVMLLAFVGHVGATRGPGVLLGQPADFAFLHYSLVHYPWVFYPYYLLFAASGAFHLTHGFGAALVVLGVKVPRPWLAMRAKPFWALAGLTSLILAIGLLALGGLFFEVDTTRFAEIDALRRRFYP